MKMKLIALVLFGLSFLTATAQDNVNMKFGKPTKEEMQMTVYSAHACHKGSVGFLALHLREGWDPDRAGVC